jgi:predicted nuclease of restriction endonuclease-like (RecB) superfamily
LFYRLNFSSLLYIAGLEEPLKRAFYEQEAIRGCWTFRELYDEVQTKIKELSLNDGSL